MQVGFMLNLITQLLIKNNFKPNQLDEVMIHWSFQTFWRLKVLKNFHYGIRNGLQRHG